MSQGYPRGWIERRDGVNRDWHAVCDISPFTTYPVPSLFVPTLESDTLAFARGLPADISETCRATYEADIAQGILWESWLTYAEYRRIDPNMPVPAELLTVYSYAIGDTNFVNPRHEDSFTFEAVTGLDINKALEGGDEQAMAQRWEGMNRVWRLEYRKFRDCLEGGWVYMFELMGHLAGIRHWDDIRLVFWLGF
jgi:hypothetical protein